MPRGSQRRVDGPGRRPRGTVAPLAERNHVPDGRAAPDPGGVHVWRTRVTGWIMAVTASGTQADRGRGPDRCRIGLGEGRLVLAAEVRPASASVVAGAALALVDHRRPAVVAIDLRRLTFLVVPHAASDEMRIVLDGELDLGTAPMLIGALTFALCHEPLVVVVDARRLAFIDARSAGLLAGAASAMREWNGTLVVRGPIPTVRRVFELCGLADLLIPFAPLVTMEPVA